ncbi:hypothetical protein IFM89_017644 [Coptis chinensis]|uniref:Uncharacterized protein n=1 Tax=Coptis chinensis TaxID=261450 RepID=A0A835GWS8_9MAGN|nr:hypothetical protein IFM89_017644 [Coptis chinensis]
MASACVNNTSLGNFFDSPSHDWFNPRSSSKIDGAENKSSEDFEFQLEDSVKMLPADELFSDGKLMPLLNIQTISNRLNVVSSSSYDEEHG